MNCPKCGFELPDGSLECAACGVIFSKLGDTPPPRRHPPLDEPRIEPYGVITDMVEDGPLGPREIRNLVIAFVVALVVYLIPITRAGVGAMVTLFHEFGHAAAGWFFGSPSIPAFDFVYGGGLTSRSGFKLSIAVAIGLAWIGLAWVCRHNKKTMVLVLSLFGLWFVFVSAGWRRDLVFSAMGHLGELVLAGAFFYMALANVGFRSPESERPVALFIAFFVSIHSIHFSWKLRYDPDFIAWYRTGKGGMLMNDLEQVSLDVFIFTGWNPGLDGVAGLLLLASFLPFAIALVLYRFRSRVNSFVSSLLTADGN